MILTTLSLLYSIVPFVTCYDTDDAIVTLLYCSLCNVLWYWRRYRYFTLLFPLSRAMILTTLSLLYSIVPFVTCYNPDDAIVTLLYCSLCHVLWYWQRYRYFTLLFPLSRSIILTTLSLLYSIVPFVTCYDTDDAIVTLLYCSLCNVLWYWRRYRYFTLLFPL